MPSFSDEILRQLYISLFRIQETFSFRCGVHLQATTKAVGAGLIQRVVFNVLYVKLYFQFMYVYTKCQNN